MEFQMVELRGTGEKARRGKKKQHDVACIQERFGAGGGDCVKDARAPLGRPLQREMCSTCTPPPPPPLKTKRTLPRRYFLGGF